MFQGIDTQWKRAVELSLNGNHDRMPKAHTFPVCLAVYEHVSSLSTSSAAPGAPARRPVPSERAEVLAGGERLRVPRAEHLTPPLQRLA